MRRNDTRPLTVNGQPWEYKIGRNTVAIYDPQGKRYFPRFEEIVDEEDLKNKIFQITPAMLVNHILTKIIGENPKYFKCVCCHTVKADVYLRPNPYKVEIHDDDTPDNYCNSCIADLEEEI